MHLDVGFSTETELKQFQDLLYEKSGQGVSFTGLLEAMANEVTIVTAVHNIKSNKGSKTAGVDRMKMDRYLQMPKEELLRLIQENFSNYKPKPAKRKYIEKSQRQEATFGYPHCVRQDYSGVCPTDSRTDMRSEILSAQLRVSPIPGAEARNPRYCQCHKCKCEIQRSASMGS